MLTGKHDEVKGDDVHSDTRGDNVHACGKMRCDYMQGEVEFDDMHARTKQLSHQICLHFPTQ